MSAIASNIWAIYDKSGRASLNEDSLEMLMLDCEEGRLALVPVNTVLLAVLGDRNVGPGMLRYIFKYGISLPKLPYLVQGQGGGAG